MSSIVKVPVAAAVVSPAAVAIPPAQVAPASSIVAAGSVHYSLRPLAASQTVLAAAASRELAAEPLMATEAAGIAPTGMRPWVVQLAMPVVQPVSTATITVASSVTIVNRASIAAAAVAATATAIDSSLELDRKSMELAASEVAAAVSPWAYSWKHWAS